MEGTLIRFVRALRMAEVRVSTAETLEAFRAAELVGWRDRQRFKDALGAVLAKSRAERDAFDDCFDRFFRVEDFSTDNRARSDDEADRQPDAVPAPDDGDGREAGRGDSAGNGAGRGGGSGGAEADRERSAGGEGTIDPAAARAPDKTMAPPVSPLGRLLMADDRTALALAITRAARAQRLEDIRAFTQQGLYTRRILEHMGRADLLDEIAAREAAIAAPERRLGAELRTRYDRLRRQVRDHVEDRFNLHADADGSQLRERMLRRTRIDSVPRRDEAHMRRIIARMARRLVAAHSRRRRVTRRGRLDVPRTLRRNMRHDGTLIELAWRSRRIDRPRLFVVCDVSGSVARHARFMLTFLHGLGAVLPRVRAFAFCARLGEVTDVFRQHDPDTAMQHALAEHGHGATDYGRALADFETLALEDLDRRSTVLILGDARNNDADPRTDRLRRIRARSGRVIWLNPEPRAAWDSGDSVIGRYRAHCHQVSECGSLAQLERVVSELLRRVG